ncbi:hypothetical protein BKA69DRAFT_64432 [Paraphysoderma sedebokerense]|nr:hypothetical protein BKA69DRAFT_64432 [Paraphysoderma sedebokerense]
MSVKATDEDGLQTDQSLRIVDTNMPKDGVEDKEMGTTDNVLEVDVAATIKSYKLAQIIELGSFVYLIATTNAQIICGYNLGANIGDVAANACGAKLSNQDRLAIVIINILIFLTISIMTFRQFRFLRICENFDHFKMYSRMTRRRLIAFAMCVVIPVVLYEVLIERSILRPLFFLLIFCVYIAMRLQFFVVVKVKGGKAVAASRAK